MTTTDDTYIDNRGRSTIFMTDCSLRRNITIVSILCVTVVAHAQETARIHTGRYTETAIIASAAQREPLRAIVTITFPPTIKTVGEALRYLLKNSGYRLVQDSSNFSAVMNLPLPEVHRKLGPIPVTTFLNVLAGQAYELVVDPVHRLVSFDLKTEYTDLVVPLNSEAQQSPQSAPASLEQHPPRHIPLPDNL
jgi:conjugative transfer region protein (TIGR03748 family)